MKRDLPEEERIVGSGMAREDLYFFSRWMFMRRKGFKWQKANHHSLVCDALMRVFTGECTRLIINIPPRYSKTELAVVNFIAWSLGHAPDSEFIHLSYSGELAAANSSNIMQVVQHEAYRDIFPEITLANDAKHHWRTTAGGVVYTSGVGGTLTGFGAGKERGDQSFGGAIVIDDPHKADEARSDVVRKSVITHFQNTVESRKNSKRTPIIVMMQRLHEEDLAGWLLAGGNGEKWEHLCLPALSDTKPYQALWPEKHDVPALQLMQRASPYIFAGQYQQRPAPLEGGLFKPDQLVTVDAVPVGNIRWIRGWDLGSTDDGDYTAGARIGALEDGRFIIGHVLNEQMKVHDRDAALINTAKADGRTTKISIPQDPGQAGKTQVVYLTRALAGFRVSSSPESGDKITRAEPFAAQVNVGNVLILRGGWNEPLREQMRNFPNSKFDDMIDACSRAFEGLVGKRKMSISDALSEENMADERDLEHYDV